MMLCRLSAPPREALTMSNIYCWTQGNRKTDSSANLRGGMGFFPQGGISKKIPLPAAVAKYLGFLPGTLREFLRYMAKPQIFGHIPP